MISIQDFILVILVFLIIGAIWWYASIPSNLPPGPVGLPFIGSTLDTWRVDTWFQNMSQWAKQYGSVYKVYVGNQLVLVLADAEAIHEALVQQGDAFAGRPPFHLFFAEEAVGKGLANSEGEIWKRQRRFCLSTLRDFGIGRPIIEPRIKQEAEYLLEYVGSHNGKPFDLINPLGNATANIVSGVVFGLRFQYDDKNFHRLLHLIKGRLGQNKFTSLSPVVLSDAVGALLSPLPFVKDMKASAKELMDFIRAEAKNALGNFQVDKDEPMNYVQAFYKAQHERKEDWTFTDDNLIASVVNLFVAGTDTTATTLRWAIFFMAHYPEYQERVYEEIKRETGGQSLLDYADRRKLPFTEATLSETQRLASILLVNLLRRTVAPTKLRGYDIPKGTVVAAMLGSASYDPKVYPNPREFNPNRFLVNGKRDTDVFFNLMPFGAGKRLCVGESMAKMELFMFFTALITKYRFYFPPGQPKPTMVPPPAMLQNPVPFKICAEPRAD